MISLYIVIFIIILIYFYYIIKIESDINTVKNKIKNAYTDGYSISLSLIPVFKTSHMDYKKFFDLIDIIELKESNLDMFNKSKISIKLGQLGINYNEQINNFHKILKYSDKRNVFVWIASVFRHDLELEIHTYIFFRKLGYQNIGITLSTCNSEILQNVNIILNMQGHIRLVKGFYKGNIKNWNEVSNFFLQVAIKLVKSDLYHCIATHDFNIIKKLLSYQNNKIEYAFFYSSKKYVAFSINKYNLQLNRKSLYIHYGDVIPYLRDNLIYLDHWNIMKRYLNNIYSNIEINI